MNRALAAAALLLLGAAGAAQADPSQVLAQFQRPTTVPAPADNPYSARAAVLGERLFNDPRLSGDDSRSCASCHAPILGWSDGLALAAGNDGKPLRRRSPALWDVAFGGPFFWDGRAATLEDQALGPIQDKRELDQTLDALVEKLKAAPGYARQFAAAFPDRPAITAAAVARAIATYERTIRSGESPFDRYAAGDGAAIGESARRGFALFVGAAGCAACHAGWQFTDHGFHDIGLPGADRGRGEATGDANFDHAFKTPTLREVARRPFYMHDGRFSTLRQVLEHYRFGVARRPTLSASLLSPVLSDADVDDLIAFLETLGADRAPPKLPFATDSPVARVETDRVAARDTAFAPRAIRLGPARRLALANDDRRVHAVRASGPDFAFAAGAQKPGETVTVEFPAPGLYDVICTIHPRMTLSVEVTP